tara:strand:+ start:16383 stop:16610 length:228 start_codon:yes stop_codon:yes gene_type:complete
MKKSWPEERSEIAIWLSGFLGIYKKWVDKILDNDDHDVTKIKIIELLEEWISKLEEMKLQIIKMPDTPKRQEEDI